MTKRPFIAAAVFFVTLAGCAGHVEKCLKLSPDDEIYKSKDFFQFKDPGLHRYSLGHWDTNEDCSLSQSELDAVTEIPKNAFMMTDSMRSTCNDNPESARCLQVYSIDELKLLKNLEVIGENAFYNQGTIETVDHPNVRYLGWDAFGGNKVTEINLPGLQGNTHPVHVQICTPHISVPLTDEGYFPVEVPVECIAQIPKNPSIQQFYFYFNNWCLHKGMSYLISSNLHTFRLRDLDTVTTLPQEIFSYAKNWDLCVYNCGEVNTYCGEECDITISYDPCYDFDDYDRQQRCIEKKDRKRNICYESCNHTGEFCKSQCRTNNADELRSPFNEDSCRLDISELSYLRNLTTLDMESFRGRETTGEFVPKGQPETR